MKIRRILRGILVLFTLAICVGIVFSSVSAAEVIGQVKKTDIKAYINGYEIPAYSIDGKTAVITSDLKNYGFNTYYDNTDRSSNIVLKESGAKIDPIVKEDDKAAFGEVIADVYKSDIVVKVNGKSVTGYNIGGKMAVKFSDLKTFGEYYESKENKTCSLMIEGLQLNKDCGTALRFTIKGENFTYQSWLTYSLDNICKDYSVSNGNSYSYCITDTRANDLRMVKKYKGEPDTLYVVSADVRTKDVVNHENPNDPMGASISAGDYTCSASVLGTSEWKTLSFVGRTDKDGYITVSLNLGYWSNTCTGTAWFDNVRISKLSDYKTEDKTWNFLAVIMTDTSLNTYDGDLGCTLKLHYEMSDDEVSNLKKHMAEFEKDIPNISGGMMEAKVDVAVCEKNFSKFTKDKAYGYVINAEEGNEYCAECSINPEDYDHVFFILNLPSLPKEYFGLGGTNIIGQTGYSVIIFDGADAIKGAYESAESWSPSVYVHEFLHYIENYSRSYGFEIPSIHDAEKFGYKHVCGWRGFYSDFMTKNVVSNGEKLGVEPVIWNAAPHKFR